MGEGVFRLRVITEDLRLLDASRQQKARAGVIWQFGDGGESSSSPRKKVRTLGQYCIHHGQRLIRFCANLCQVVQLLGNTRLRQRVSTLAIWVPKAVRRKRPHGTRFSFPLRGCLAQQRSQMGLVDSTGRPAETAQMTAQNGPGGTPANGLVGCPGDTHRLRITDLSAYENGDKALLISKLQWPLRRHWLSTADRAKLAVATVGFHCSCAPTDGSRC